MKEVSYFFGTSTVEAGLGPIGASASVVRLRHLAIVLGRSAVTVERVPPGKD